MLRRFLFSVIGCMTCYAQAELPSCAHRIIQQHDQSISLQKRAQIQSALAAFNTLMASDVTYISCPITSGSRLYQYMDTQGYHSLHEAMHNQEDYIENVVKPNLAKSDQVAKSVAERLSGVIITPTTFEKGFHTLQNPEEALLLQWGQHEFMSLWLRAIEHKMTRIVFVDGWQYSSGASEEFLWASLMQMGFMSSNCIEILDERENPITLDQGATLLHEAIVDIEGRGLRSTTLREVLKALVEAENVYRQSSFALESVPIYDHGVFLSLGEAIGI